MFQIINDKRVVCYCNQDDILDFDYNNRIIYSVKDIKTNPVDLSLKKSFFRDRCINVRIAFKTFEFCNNDNKVVACMCFEKIRNEDLSPNVIEQVKTIAQTVLLNDSRFKLFEEDSTDMIIDLIRRYVDSCIERSSDLFVCMDQDEIIGFIFYCSEGDSIENLLGAVCPSIVGKMIAPSLYSRLILEETKNGKMYYYAKISTENVASMNLHFALGAKVVSVFDRFVERIN